MSVFGSAVRRAGGKEDKKEDFSDFYFLDKDRYYVSGLKKIGEVSMNIMSFGYCPHILMSFSRESTVEFRTKEIEYEDMLGNLRMMKIKSQKIRKGTTRVCIEVGFDHPTDHTCGRSGGRHWGEKMIMLEAEHIVKNMDEIVRRADDRFM